MKAWKSKKLALVLIILVIGALTSILSSANVFGSWQNKLTNRLFEPSQVSNEIVILALDQASAEAINEGVDIDDRAVVAQTLENIIKLDPHVLAVDRIYQGLSGGIKDQDLRDRLKKLIDKEEVSKKDLGIEFMPYIDSPHPTDKALVEAFSKVKNLILATFPQDILKIKSGVIGDKLIESNSIFYTESTILGNIGVKIDEKDSIVRKYFTTLQTKDREKIDSLAVAAARAFGNPFVDQIPTIDENKSMYINYFGLPGAFKTISAIDAYRGSVNREDIEGKIVLFGATSPKYHDNEHTPIAPREQMAGIEIHANALQTILEGKFLVDAPAMTKIIVIFGMTIIAVGAFMFFSIRSSLAVLLLLWVGYYFLNQIAFDKGLILDQIFPYLALILALPGTYIYKYFTEAKEKQFIADAFGSYVSPEVLKEIQDDPSKLELGGIEKNVSVFFSDIAGFTNISEKLTPQELVSLLNKYFSEMSEIIIDNMGTVDKFEGDAIMAVFGAPLNSPNHVIRACQAALQTQTKLAELRKELAAAGRPELHCRIGINSGPVVAGNVGSAERFDYTVIGDTVNLGSRLEGANKFYGTSIMIGPNTYNVAKDYFITRQLDRLKVKGKDKPINAYELMGITEGAKPELVQLANTFNEGMALYFEKRFEEAKAKFEICLNLKAGDSPSNVMIIRCKSYIKEPPQAAWDGVFTLKTK